MRTKLVKLAFIGFVAAASQILLAAQAHHRNGHNGGPPHRGNTSDRGNTSESRSREDSDRDLTPLTTAQRTLLNDLLTDTNHPDAILVDSATRADIQSQIDSLPPGIQRRLARGRSLPPGIAKKVSLPATVNDQLGIDEDVQVIVIGRDVAVVDPVTGLIVDILREVLL